MKKVETYKGFGIYERTDAELKRSIDELGCILPRFEVYLPGESPDAFDAAEWDADALQECHDFIDSYDSGGTQ